MNIAGFLEGDTKALLNLSYVSRLFNQIATPLLYSNFRQLESWPVDKNKTLYAFLWTVLSRPHLAEHVKHIALQQMGTDEGLGLDPDQELIDLATQRINTTCSSLLRTDVAKDFNDEWLAAIRNTIPEAYLTLLICALPNLETLFFVEGYEPNILYTVLKAVVTQLKQAKILDEVPAGLPFTKLRTVKTWSDDMKYGYLGFDGLYPFFELPSMRGFEIGLANGEWGNIGAPDGAQMWKIEPRSSNIDKLSFQYSAFTGPCMRAMVRSCKSLKQFQFTYGKIHMYEVDFFPKDLLDELLGHADSLEVLRINYDDDWDKVLWHENEIESSDLVFDSKLKKLTKLKQLSVNSSILFGPNGDGRTDNNEPEVLVSPARFNLAESLPPLLEELEIYTCDANVVLHLSDIAQARMQGQLKSLALVRCYVAEEKIEQGDLNVVEIPGVKVDCAILSQEEREALIDIVERGYSNRPLESFILQDHPLLWNA